MLSSPGLGARLWQEALSCDDTEGDHREAPGRGLPAACWRCPLRGLTLPSRPCPKIGKPGDGPEA